MDERDEAAWIAFAAGAIAGESVSAQTAAHRADELLAELRKRREATPEPEEVTCPGCGGAGTWETECCSGAGGCSCRGQVIDMGTCGVCGGRGSVIEGEHDPRANIRAIEGQCYIGSGPTGGGW